MVLWSYHLEHIIPLCKDFEEKLIKHIWRTRNIGRKPLASSTTTSFYGGHSREESHAELNEKGEATPDKEAAELQAQEKAAEAAPPKRSGLFGWWRLQPRDPNSAAGETDAEKAKRKERKLVIIGPVYAGLGIGLSACEFKFSWPCLFRFFHFTN